jgi:hypothetical protein
MRRAHFHVEPPVDQFLQAGLATKVFGRSVMRKHVFPGIDLEHVAFRRVRMGAVRLAPGEPPVVYRAFLLAADIAIKSFGPSHRRHPVVKLDFLHEGSLHDGRRATRHFVSFCNQQTQQNYQIPYFPKPCGAFTQPSTGVPQFFAGRFIRTQHLLDRIDQQSRGKNQISRLHFLG